MALTPLNDAATAASPIDGFGTILECSDDGTTWNQVANLVDIKPGGTKRNKVKTTTHSTTDKNDTYRAGRGDPGEKEFECLYDATVYAALKAMEGVTKHWRVTYTDEATDAQKGFIAELTKNTPEEGDVTITVKVQMSGDEVFTAPA